MIPLRKIFLILFLPFASRAFCQFPDSFLIDSLSGKFIKSLRLDGKEEIFLHTNKSFYRAGEDRFRAYCINTLSHKIMQQSKSLFVDLVSDQDSLVSQIMLNMVYLNWMVSSTCPQLGRGGILAQSLYPATNHA